MRIGRAKATAPRRRSRSAAVIITSLAIAIAACGGDDDADDRDSGASATSDAPAPTTAETDTSEPAAEPATGGTLRVAVQTDPSSLDPQVGPSGTDHQILYPMYDTLTSFDPATLEPLPGLAESWEFVEPTKLVLQLREGVIFHDGSPLDADAVVNSLKRFQDMGAHADLASVESIEATGDLEVTLSLAQPDSSLVLVLADRAGMVVPPSATDAGEAFAESPIGTGPFQFVEYLPGNKVVYERFEDYWNPDEPKLDRIEMLVITDRKAAANALQSGQVDFADGLDSADVGQLEDRENITVRADVGLWFDMVYFNLGQAPLDDARVRRAINMAIDRDALIASVVDGYGEPAWMPVPESHWAYDPASAEAWPHDVEAARALMEEAGYGDGVTISIVTGPSAVDARRNEVLQAQLAEIGIKLEVNSMDVNQGVERYFEKESFQTAQWAWSGRPDPGQTYYRLFAAASYQNPADVEIPNLEDKLTEAVTTDDLAARAEIYAEANPLITEFAPYAPLYFRHNITAYTDAVQGYEPSLLGKPRVAGLSLTK